VKNMNKKIIIGFDLGGTKMLVAAYDEKFEKLCFIKRKSKGANGQKEGLKRIVETIDMLLEENKLKKSSILCIGLGIPGPIDPDKGIAINLPNMGWEMLEIEKLLTKEYDCHVKIINDVDAGTYAEYLFGAAKKAKCAIGIFPGTGIGGGCVVNGNVYEGKISSMEIGHIKVETPGRICGCGNYGCLETVASRLAIASEVSKAAYRGKAPYISKRTGTDIADIKSGAIAKAIENGDDVVEQIVIDACKEIGAVAGSILVNLFSPDYIILGGGLIEAMPELFVKHVKSATNKTCMDLYKDSFKVVAAKLGDDATVLGAAAWAEHSLKK
jgi:glucokinase